MMLLHRWAVAGLLVAASALSAGQSGSQKKPSPHPLPNVVQPDEGAPPDQAQQPDQAAPLDPAIPPEPAMPPPEPVEKQEPAPSAPPEPVEKQEPAPSTAPAKVSQPEPSPLAATPEQRQLQIDAAHLLQLIQDLKVEVDKAGANTLSLEAVRKADEVQRLSKSLKERVKVWSQAAPGK